MAYWNISSRQLQMEGATALNACWARSVCIEVLGLGLCLLLLLTRSNRLNKFWQNQDIMYNFKLAQLHATEVIVQLYTKNLSKLEYCKVVTGCGHKGSGLHLCTQIQIQIQIQCDLMGACIPKVPTG